MRLRLSLLALCIPLAAGCTLSTHDRDKAVHLIGGAAVAAYVERETGSKWKGCAAALGVGLLKEAVDSRTGGVVDAKDVIATGAGCSVTWVF